MDGSQLHELRHLESLDATEGCDTDSSTDLGYEVASEGIGTLQQEDLASLEREEELQDIVDSLSLEQLRQLVISAAQNHCDTLAEVRAVYELHKLEMTQPSQVVSAAVQADAQSVVSASTTSLDVRESNVQPTTIMLPSPQDCPLPGYYYRPTDSLALPDEILLVIFSTLDHTSLARAGSVNRQWRAAAFQRWRQLHSALLAGEHVAPPSAPAEVCHGCMYAIHCHLSTCRSCLLRSRHLKPPHLLCRLNHPLLSTKAMLRCWRLQPTPNRARSRSTCSSQLRSTCPLA